MVAVVVGAPFVADQGITGGGKEEEEEEEEGKEGGGEEEGKSKVED